MLDSTFRVFIKFYIGVYTVILEGILTGFMAMVRFDLLATFEFEHTLHSLIISSHR
jgi:hypothetical protein